MTNFAQALDDTEFTEKQFDMYLKAVEPYRLKFIILNKLKRIFDKRQC